jgi:hypothetical protein
MIPGHELTLGGQVYVVPPLNLAGVKQMQGRLSSLFESGMPDMDTVAQALFLAMRRNYPEMTREAIDELVDYGNMLDILDAVMNTSGLVAKAGEMMARLTAGAPVSPK